MSRVVEWLIVVEVVVVVVVVSQMRVSLLGTGLEREVAAQTPIPMYQCTTNVPRTIMVRWLLLTSQQYNKNCTFNQKRKQYATIEINRFSWSTNGRLFMSLPSKYAAGDTKC